MIKDNLKLFTIFFLVFLVSTSYVVLSDDSESDATSITLTSGTVGVSYVYDVATVAYADSVSWSVTSGSLPSGLGANRIIYLAAASPTGSACTVLKVSGTPTESGTFTATLTGSGVKSGSTVFSVSYTVTITVASSNIPVVTTYTIVLNASGNGGTINSNSTYTITTTNTSTSLAGYVAQKSGCNFDGWFTTVSGGSKVTTTSSFSGTLYAHFSSPSTYVLTISYNANGGSGAPANQTATSTNSTVSYTVSSTIPTRSGYTFVEWSMDPVATIMTTVAGAANSTMMTGATYTIVWYAIWSNVVESDSDPITIDTTSVTEVISGNSYSYTLSYTCDIDCSISWTVPSWISVSSDYLTISGTSPTDLTAYRQYTILAKIYNDTDSQLQSFTLTVNPDPVNLKIISSDSVSVRSTAKMTYVPISDLYGSTFGYAGDLPSWINYSTSGYFYGISPLVEDDTDYTFVIVCTLSSISVNKTITVHVAAYDPDVDLYDDEGNEITTKTFVFYFSDYSDSPVTDVLWDFGDGTGSVDLNPTHTYSESGWYVVRCTFFNDYGSDYIEIGLSVTDEISLFDSFVIWITAHYIAVIAGFAVLIMVIIYTYPRVKSRKGVKRL